MKVTTPKEKESNISKLQEAVDKFEKQFAKEEKDEQCYHLIISGEYNRQTCDEVERIYTEAGWMNVTCRTSSEKAERGGFTGLILYR